MILNNVRSVYNVGSVFRICDGVLLRPEASTFDKPTADKSDGQAHGKRPFRNPNVFKLERLVDGLWLADDWARPDDEWRPEDELVFRKSRSLERERQRTGE